MNKDNPRRPRRRLAAAASEPAGRLVQDHAGLSRYRFLLPLCEGRNIADAGAPGWGRELVASTAASVTDARPGAAADVVLALDPLTAGELERILPGLTASMTRNGILAIAVTGPAEPARTVLRSAFAHVACFHERAVAGSIIMDERFAQSRIVPLREPATDSRMSLHLGSDQPLPALNGGLLEEPRVPLDAMQDHGSYGDGANGTVPSLGSMIAELAEVFEGQGSAGTDGDLQGRAVTLVERLMDVEDETLELRLENRRLRTERKATPRGGGDSRYSDLPAGRHGWPMAERADVLPEALDPYDRRVDDAVLLEGRRGAAFFARFGLLEGAPDFAGAVQALNAMARRLRLAGGDSDAAPDASIVVPIYGQLGYTLNCLESLFLHRSRYSAEIIIIDDLSPDSSGDHLPDVKGIRYHRQPVNGGFIQSCTTGGQMARGRFVIMLNNDTRVVDGWLDELLDTFSIFPSAGAVGSKLFYSDGTLQEAGGIIWRDGTAWNFGRNDDPNRPQYCYARQVDYVSGCSLALPADIWRALNGFDQYFRPAYCEDSDLCLRVTNSGRELWLQPQSRVVHYEGKTSGTDLKTGVKAYQVINQKKLFLRWRERLTGHRPNGEAPLLERERNVRKRALIIDATAPTPKQDAGSVTTTLTLGLFREIGYKPSFVPQDNFLFQPTYITDLQRMGVECAYAPYDVDFDTYMQQNGWLFDVILVYRVTVLEKVLDSVRRHAPQAPVLFHNMDLHFLRMEREATLTGDADAMREAEAMKIKECDLISRVDCTITHSTYEQEVLAREVPDAPVVVWPFMFEFFGTQVGFKPRRDIVFLGGYKHRPNVDAVKFFANDVFPIIKRQEPNARFVIAGANPSDEVLALANESVIVTGLVDDLRDVFDTSRVFACSLRIGAGTKGKVSTAMSYGLPVVSTTCGAEGMDLIDGDNVLIADDAETFAKACLRLYRNRKLWDHVSQAGQRLVKENHSLAMGRRVLAQAIEVAYQHRLDIAPATA